MTDLAGDAAVYLSVSGIIAGTLLVASGLFVRSSLYDKAVTGRLLDTYSKHLVIFTLDLQAAAYSFILFLFFSSCFSFVARRCASLLGDDNRSYFRCIYTKSEAYEVAHEG
jgi:hypothetical protein